MGQFLYVVGGWTGGVANWFDNHIASGHEFGARGLGEWPGIHPCGRSDFGLAYDPGTNKSVCAGRRPSGTVVSSTRPMRLTSLRCQAGPVEPGDLAA